MTKRLELGLPWPPTVNHIWKRGNRRTYLTAKGNQWYTAAVESIHDQLCSSWPVVCEERVRVSIRLHPPNRRKWDLDNRTKCVLDALTRAGVWLDDEQVDELHLTRCSLDPNKQGFALVTVEVLP